MIIHWAFFVSTNHLFKNRFKGLPSYLKSTQIFSVYFFHAEALRRRGLSNPKHNPLLTNPTPRLCGSACNYSRRTQKRSCQL